jgi:hypothetical protein
VELSIVLVILGLLTGGILTGQNLIRAAELRSVVTEFQSHQTAVQSFRDKYFAIPGDMRNASDFWGYPGGNAANCPATAGTGTETCNGNGDGVLNSGSANQYGEHYLFWQHMANAGLVEGNYTGRVGSGGSYASVPGTNVPASKLGNAGWTADNDASNGNSSMYTVAYGNVLKFGGVMSGGTTQAAILTPEEAWGIDKKVDDGLPARGKLIARYWNNACAAADDGSSANDDLNASYRLTDKSVQCALIFRQLF